MKIVLDLAPHDVTRAVEALDESRGMIAMEVARKLEMAATEAIEAGAVERILDLHEPGYRSPADALRKARPVCQECSVAYPCATVRAVNNWGQPS